MERIHVAVRARPLPPEDAKTSPWRFSGNSISIPNNPYKFEFDRIFGEECKTLEVYQARTKDIVAAAVRGFNGTIFAYGQTNSGKTHTMRGSASEPGVIPLSVRDLFDIIQKDVDREFLLRMSYMEIYNEEINDLLVPEHRKLQIHENLERGIYVAGLREEIVASPEQVLDLMEYGESYRHIGQTNMNLYSSRSHTIFRMIIESRDKTEDEDMGNACDAVRVSVLNLVDLAGSERAAKTGAEGVRLKEGSHINKSLMTLGTVIKKLSEGAESQGGHVPYRDSKLTRILQPALGGNANTAMICNITLAQIHADETKSSLLFASRALRVTNCAHVNEILTDAALLKRQKKEIEELRAKLQGSHSEHFEEEILNLRNTLLQTELERERIALELEEEKKAQAERERRLQEQAKKIENLSSMVLFSNRDDNRDHIKKERRRDTWCPGNLSQETVGEMCSTVQSKVSAVRPMKPKRDMGPLLPFDELLNEIEVDIDDPFKQEEKLIDDELVESTIPDPYALLHVTNRRKAPLKKKSLSEVNSELVEMQAEYEDLLLNFETQTTKNEIEIDCLKRRLADAERFLGLKYNDSSTCQVNKTIIYGDKNLSLKESESIHVIKQLHEQIELLEMEKSSSLQNLDSVVELATEQNISTRSKFEELHEELVNAREEARVTREKLASQKSLQTIDEGNFDSMAKLLMEVQEIMLELENSKKVVENVSSLVDEVFQSMSSVYGVFFDLKALMCQSSLQQKSVISMHEKLHSSTKEKIFELESEKLLLHNQFGGLQKQIEELRQEAQNSEKALTVHFEQQEMEKSELLSYIQTLEKELSSLSFSSLAKEKENLRRDLEKVKTKLKETDFKLKNAIQEKTKLEGEKAAAEREIKLLHGQKTLLERDINKRDSLAGRRRDSVVDRSSKAFDSKRLKGHTVPFEQTVQCSAMQEEYKKLEVLAFEMETTIASLEDELAAAYREKEEAISRNQNLVSELETLSERLSTTNSEFIGLQEEVSCLKLSLEQSKSTQQKMESSIKMLLEEKEELAMHLTESLLEMEEEKAIWSAKEKASIEAIEEKSKLYNEEIMLLSKGMSEVRNELESCKEECKVLRVRLSASEEDAEWKKRCSMEKSLGIDQLKNDHKTADSECKQSKEDGDKLTSQIEEQQNVEEEFLRKRYNGVLLEAKVQVEELTGRISSMEIKMHNDEVSNSKEKAKLRMRLRWTHAKLDAFRYRHKEAAEELDFMNMKYEEASGKLKDRLASYGIEVLNLRKQLAAAKGQ